MKNVLDYLKKYEEECLRQAAYYRKCIEDNEKYIREYKETARVNSERAKEVRDVIDKLEK